MFDVENVPPELLLLMGSRLCLGGEVLDAAGATLINQAMLRNPGGSGAILTLLSIRVSDPTSQDFVWGPTLNTLAVASPTAFSDTRVFGEGTVGQVLNEPLLVPGPIFGAQFVTGGRGFEIAVPRGLAVIAPGAAFSISSTVANLPMSFCFTWVERTAQPSELNL